MAHHADWVIRANPRVYGAWDRRYKTELCNNWTEQGACRYGDKCRFAHGEEELRPRRRPKLYKTKPCHAYVRRGTCAYGRRCHYIHGEALNLVK